MSPASSAADPPALPLLISVPREHAVARHARRSRGVQGLASNAARGGKQCRSSLQAASIGALSERSVQGRRSGHAAAGGGASRSGEDGVLSVSQPSSPRTVSF